MKKATILLLAILSTSFAVTLPAYGQFGQNNGTPVSSGEYVNEEFGISVVIPESSFNSYEQVDEPSKSFTLFVTWIGVENAQTSVTFAVYDKAIAEEEAKKALAGMSAEERAEVERYKDSCTDDALPDATINGKTFDVFITECDIDGYKTQSKSYVTEINGMVYSASAHSVYEFVGGSSHAFSDLDEIVKTLKIEGSIDASTNTLVVSPSLSSFVQTVSLSSGESIDLDIQSSSTISDFSVNESSKQISFTVTGDDGTEGTATLAISRVLEGPYTVTIDGDIMSDFETTTEPATGETIMTITYTHSTHDIVITGTQVVPEFSAIIAVVLAISVAGVIAVSSLKTRRMI